MAFDPNAATARYIDSLGPAALQKAHDYTVGKEWMLLWALLVGALVTWLIVSSGVLDRLDAKFDQRRRATFARLSSASLFGRFVASSACPGHSTPTICARRAYGRTGQPLGDFLARRLCVPDLR